MAGIALEGLPEDDCGPAGRDQQLIEEAIASGPEQPLTRSDLDKIRDSILDPKKL